MRIVFITLTLICIGVIHLNGQQSQDQTVSAKQPVLVELFTTEGCSDCPPADKLLMELEQRQPIPNAEIIALGFHVDYFNQLGWVDRFSATEFTARQKRYIKEFKEPDVFTPQIVVDGSVEANGPKPTAQAIVQAASSPKPVQVLMERHGDSLQIHVRGKLQQPVEAFIAVAEDNLETVIKAGENRGQTLHHVAVVREFQSIGHLKDDNWTQTVQLKIPSDVVKANAQVVAFLQEEHSGRVVGLSAMKL